MLTQWFCITHNSLSPILRALWDQLAPTVGTVSAAGLLQWHWPICPCLKAVMSILSSLAINDHIDEQEKCSPVVHFYPPLTSLQVCGIYFLADFILSVPHTHTVNPYPHQTHFVAGKGALSLSVFCLQ